jgi:hypothetical protein
MKSVVTCARTHLYGWRPDQRAYLSTPNGDATPAWITTLVTIAFKGRSRTSVAHGFSCPDRDETNRSQRTPRVPAINDANRMAIFAEFTTAGSSRKAKFVMKIDIV